MVQQPEEILRNLEDREINSVEEFEKSENDVNENDNRSRLYWIQKNIRTKIGNWFGRHKILGI